MSTCDPCSFLQHGVQRGFTVLGRTISLDASDNFCLKQQLERVLYIYIFLYFFIYFLLQPEWPKSKTNVSQRALLRSSELARVN